MRAAIVVVAYRPGAVLQPALDAILREPETAELVLVDNGGDLAGQGWLAALAAREPRLTLIAGQGNVGFARGCNLGARASASPLLVFMNPDCVVAPGTLAQLAQALAAEPRAWAAAPLLVDAQGRPQAGTPRRELSPRTMLGEGLRLDLLAPARFPRLNLHAAAGDGPPFPIAACSGAFLAIRRARFEALGGFDEGYFLHVEDLDLCRRLGQAGGLLLCVPAVRVLHRGGTSRASTLFVERHKARGFARYLRRHCGRDLSGFALNALIALAWLRCAARVALAPLRRRPGA